MREEYYAFLLTAITEYVPTIGKRIFSVKSTPCGPIRCNALFRPSPLSVTLNCTRFHRDLCNYLTQRQRDGYKISRIDTISSYDQTLYYWTEEKC